MSGPTIGLILARGGSKGIRNKNLQKVGGIPLVGHSIIAALNSKQIDEVYVSTDSEKIRHAALQFGAKVIDRPEELATDTASSEDALLHAAQELEFETMVFIQCTSPLSLASDFDQALHEFHAGGYDSLLSVTKDHGGFLCGGFTWTKNGEPINYNPVKRPRRQDMDERYRENGAFYITTKKALIGSQNRLSGKIGVYVMPYTRSFEIDEPGDLKFLQRIYPLLEDKISKTEGMKFSYYKMVLFDVDGCFTDGSVYLDEGGNESLRFSRIDGKGIELLHNAGYLCGVISSEDSNIVRARMKKLKMSEIRLGVQDKLSVLQAILDSHDLEEADVIYCGDDIQDIEIMKAVGYSFSPRNAQPQVKEVADYVSEYPGGDGFIRDVANILLSME